VRERFTRTERALHWVHATAFLVLLASGAVLWSPRLAELVARRPLVEEIHLYTALAWAFALVLVVQLGDGARLRATLRELELFDRDDRRWLLGRRTPQGRFNAGQKLNAALTAAFAVLFAVSGLLLWLGQTIPLFRGAGALVLHDGVAAASLVLLVGHLYLSVIHPATRHSLQGMTRGTVSEEWARKHHPKWVED
jgi:formate dehydrogenase subunit gamma